MRRVVANRGWRDGDGRLRVGVSGIDASELLSVRHAKATSVRSVQVGGRRLAEEMKVPFLGAVPLDPRIGKSADYGVSFLDEYPDSPATAAYLDIIDSKFHTHIFILLCLLRSLEIKEQLEA